MKMKDFKNEILNGKDSGDDRKIPFKNIRSIEKEKNGVVVTLKSDRELRLTDSNDVNNKNRGIIVFDPEIGRIDIPWRDFMNLEIIEKSSRGMSYNDFPISEGLSGTVITIEGDEYEGLLVYDLDEAWEFEILDGKDDNLEFDIPFRNVKALYQRITTTLWLL